MSVSKEYLSTEEAAELLGMSPDALTVRRTRKSGPPFVRIGRVVRYPLAGLRAWLDAHTVSFPSTPQASA